MIFLGRFNKIGKAWVAVIKHIYNKGNEFVCDTERYKEIKGIAFDIELKDGHDLILEKYGNKINVAWMKENFEVIKTVEELQNANSYAARLFNYAGSKNQIDWVIKKISSKKNVRSATITTFEPLTDEGYIPCISLFDFDVVDNKLDVYVYARALDFGQKAYANLICISDLLKYTANKTKLVPGVIHLVCKSAHIYDRDYELMDVLERECN